MTVVDNEFFSADQQYHQDSLYQEMMGYFQRGNWRDGLLALNKLIEKYPLEHELRSMRQEMQLRAAMDVYEQDDKKQARRQRTVKGVIRGGIVLGVIAIMVIFFSGTMSWFRQQAEQTRQALLEQRRVFDLSSKFEQSLQLIAAYRPTEAEVLLNDIKQIDPEYPGVEEALADAQNVKELDKSYQEAVRLKSSGDWKTALAIFETIPFYRDSTLQIQQIQREFSLADLLATGDEAVQNGNWVEAISYYEQLRNQDFLYERQQVEERLYNSYISAAKTILDENPDSLEALIEARRYFQKALSVRPQDPKVFEELAVARQTVADRLYTKFIDLARKELVKEGDSITALRKAEEYFAQAQAIRPNDPDVNLQRTMAQAYIAATADFNKSKWDAVIKNLQFIFDQDADYADGTARQALYDAYVARGDGYILNGRMQSALADYQAAVTIAQMRPDSLLRLFEAQARVGDALGLMGNYETAVYQYRSALEEAGILTSVTIDPELDRVLKNAENNALRGRYRNAFNLYKGAISELIASLQTVTHVVSGEDYLSRLAKTYQTTVSAILAVNKLTDPNSIAVGDKIIIPVLVQP